MVSPTNCKNGDSYDNNEGNDADNCENDARSGLVLKECTFRNRRGAVGRVDHDRDGASVGCGHLKGRCRMGRCSGDRMDRGGRSR